MADILNVIQTRRAKRAFSPREISNEELVSLIEAAHLAPSCFNNQSWRFLVVQDTEAKKKINDVLSTANYWAQHASAYVVIMVDEEDDCKLSDDRNYALLDLGLATQNLILQAEHLGIIAHPMAGFNPNKLRDFFTIPSYIEVMAIVALGYPGEGEYLNEKDKHRETLPRQRKALSEIFFWDQYKAD